MKAQEIIDAHRAYQTQVMFGEEEVIPMIEIALSNQSGYSSEQMILFAEWIEREHYWRSTDTRFPQTVGLWTKFINGDFPVSEGLTTRKLFDEFSKDNLPPSPGLQQKFDKLKEVFGSVLKSLCELKADTIEEEKTITDYWKQKAGI